MASEVKQPQPSGFIGGWRKSIAARRELHKVRRRSAAKFRLTREGANLAFVVVFIFLGAVLRDISLLILIAAAMIGLLLLQWRFNVTTIGQLTVRRQILHRVSQGSKAQCTLTITNPNRWVGAWLVIADDTIHKVAPLGMRNPSHGRAIVDEIGPQSTSAGTYRIVFHQRGLFRVGPCTLSTRFPLGLGKGWRIIDEVDEVVVHPSLGQLQPRLKSLWQQSRDGHNHSSSHVGVHEADFFGLRPWASGDSRRWIHWRTTARLGELSVRQFDRLEQEQACVLLDLHRSPNDKSSETDHAIEMAISFVATLVHQSAVSHDNKLAIAIAGDSHFGLSGIQSSVLGNAVLDKLATISHSATPDLEAALQPITTALLANPHLVVVSTRPQQIESLEENFLRLLGPKASTRLRINWLNATRGDLEPYFTWTTSESSDLDAI